MPGTGAAGEGMRHLQTAIEVVPAEVHGPEIQRLLAEEGSCPVRVILPDMRSAAGKTRIRMMNLWIWMNIAKAIWGFIKKENLYRRKLG